MAHWQSKNMISSRELLAGLHFSVKFVWLGDRLNTMPLQCGHLIHPTVPLNVWICFDCTGPEISA